LTVDSPGQTFLGLDLGSVSLKAVVIDSDGEVVYEDYRRTHGRPIRTVGQLLGDMHDRLGDTTFGGVVATGSGKGLLTRAFGIPGKNEIVAQATAAWTLYPDVRSIIEIGGQDSKFIRVGHSASGGPFVEDHAFNELCAAGTGAFLDQMAGRLGLSIEEFGDLGAGAELAARMAGRCSVFAKTDMIHLQQRACPTDEIVAGLCSALARNYLAGLCRGRAPQAPILFQGGVAANSGVLRAFRELMNVSDDDLIRPARFRVMGALGAALLARDAPMQDPVSPGVLSQRLDAREEEPPEASGLDPLKPVAEVQPVPIQYDGGRQAADARLFFGLDVGSVSTKAVVIDAKARPVAVCYLATGGRPVDAVRKAMDEIRDQLPGEARIRYAVSTGSGRHVARDLVEADEAVDEITAQARSARHFCPDADTVFEIGGQDSKYMLMERGQVARFQMNRACAAGTGAFLEEQAGRLGLDIRSEFSKAAFESKTPARLGSRCTVFMDSDLVHHLQKGAGLDDLCAGLAWSIGQNYLEKVVGSCPVGAHVLFQGGVAKNEAVQVVMRRLVGGRLSVHPYPEVSGAWGAALIGRDAVRNGAGESSFPGLSDGVGNVTTRTFVCRSCENLCEIQQMTTERGSRRSHFGSVCGRFEQGLDEAILPDDAFEVRERLLQEGTGESDPPAPRGDMGFPMGLSMADCFPFWHAFFSVLGFRVNASGASNRDKASLGMARVPEEFCYPIKLLFGHVHHMIDSGTRRIFIPHLNRFPAPGEEKAWYACPYTQAAPYVVRENVDGADVLTLEYPVSGEEKHWVRTASRSMDIEEAEVRQALHDASNAQERFRAACRAEGKRVIDGLKESGRVGVVLLGRPYNTSDRYANLNLARRLKGLGLEPIPFDFLPIESERLPGFWDRVRWGYGREQLQAAGIIRRNPSLAAVVVTNFGCGPDSFVDQYLEEVLKDTQHIVLEFDEHQAEAGLVTRLEAFARTLRGTTGQSRKTKDESLALDPGEPTRPLREYIYYVPGFSDHAHAYVGALRGAGCRSVLLPPTDDESWQLGLRHAYGRECHPYISFLGDLLKAADRPGFVPDEAAFYGPSYFGPCLVPQYIIALKLVLRRIGLGGITPLNIADPPTMAPLGRAYIIRLGLGLYAIDRLYKWKVESEPYEEVPGEVDRVHRLNLQAIEDGLANGRFWKSLKDTVDRFRAVRLRSDAGSRPVIGMIGDAYTRVNEHANNRLYERLEGMGFEVWPSCSLIDISLLGAEQLHEEMLRKGRSVAGNAARALIPGVAGLRWLVDRHFPKDIRTPQERQFPDVRRAADRHASHWIDKLLSLNMSRIEEFREAGAQGVINAMCHNCMIGTVTAALMKPMSSGDAGFSTCTLVYEGLQSTHNHNRIEAFAHQIETTRL